MTFVPAISCTFESHGKVTLGHVMLVGCYEPYLTVAETTPIHIVNRS